MLKPCSESAFPKPLTRLCVVSSWFPSYQYPLRTPFIPAFVGRIKKTGIAVSVITVREKLDLCFELLDGTPVYRISRFFPFLDLLGLVLRIRPELIHVHAPNQFSGLAVLAARLLHIPVVATIHRVEVQPVKKKYVHVMRRIVLSLCDQIITVSKTMRLLAENCGAEKDKIEVIYNSATESIFSPRDKEVSRKSIHLPPEKAVILCVGRLVPRKGVRYLIQAMPLILEKREAVLMIVGSGSGKGALQHLVKTLNLQGNVLFSSKLSTEELALYYNAADVFVLPSLSEGHSVALLEAMASGLPIVATNIGGNDETVVDQVNGFLIPPKDPEALSKAITTILGDTELRRRFCEKSLEIYDRNFSEKIQLTKHFSIYRELLKTYEIPDSYERDRICE